MNFLQLVQRTKRESGRLSAGPLSVASAVGRDLLLIDWVNEAWQGIQMMPARNWRWMRRTALATVLPGSNSFSASTLGIPSFGYWAKASDDYAPSIFDPTSPTAEPVLVFRAYEAFRKDYLTNTAPAASTPQHWSIAPDGALLLGPAPATLMTLRVDYYRAPQELALDGDVPEMPAKFHPLIVWAALSQAAGFDAAPEALARAYDNYNRDLTLLINEQGDNIAFGANTL